MGHHKAMQILKITMTHQKHIAELRFLNTAVNIYSFRYLYEQLLSIHFSARDRFVSANLINVSAEKMSNIVSYERFKIT